MPMMRATMATTAPPPAIARLVFGFMCRNLQVPPAIAAAVVLSALVCCAPARGASADPRLAGVATFAFAGGGGTLEGDLGARYAGYDLVVLDGQEARKADVAALRASGTIVLGYLSVGTIEPFRPWFKGLRRYRLPGRSGWFVR